MKCKYCKKEIKGVNKNYCSRKCWNKHKNKTLLCESCNKSFKRNISMIHNHNFCSDKCKWKSRMNSKIINCDYCGIKIKRKKSHINKRNFCSKKCVSIFNKNNPDKINYRKGEKHHNWKGNMVKYSGVHKWIKKNFPKPSCCKNCGIKTKKLELANLSGEYKRNITDYKWLCRGCHIARDNLEKIRKRKVLYDEITSIDIINYNKPMYDIETETSNFIAENIITHNCTPMKKYFSLGYYLPNLLKEKIEVVIGIDVSGSIDMPQYSKFISEVISMARIFKERINMKIFFHDTEITAEYKIDNGNISKIRAMHPIGGGGTCFDEIIIEMLKKKTYKNTKCLIWATDGMGNRIKTQRSFPILWVLSKNGTDEYIKNDPRDKIIRLKLE